MKRKLRAMWRLLFCYGYVLITVDKANELEPYYDHTICEEDTLKLTRFITNLYEGNQDALNQAKELLDL